MTRPQRESGRLRVLFCHFTADVCGGSDKSLFDLVTRLPRERFDTMVLLRNGDPMAEQYAIHGIPVVTRNFVPPRRALELRKLLRYALSFLPAAISVARISRRFRADVVHVNTLFNLQGAVGARLARTPLVWHVRELAPDSRLADLMLHMVARLATFAVANSGAVLDSLRRCGDRARVVMNGIDASDLETVLDAASARRQLGLPEDCPVISVIGRIEPWKGQHVLIEAAPTILATHPDTRFLVVGGAAANKPEYLDSLRARCRELAIEARVLFLGLRDDISVILAASSILALPSVTPEPFGRTLVEAMLAVRPVVATAAGGPLDIVAPEVTGLLVAPDNASALADALLQLLNSPEKATEMGRRGRERAKRLFTMERVISEISAILEQTASR